MGGFFAVFGDDADCSYAFKHGMKLSHRGPTTFCYRSLVGHPTCRILAHELLVGGRSIGMQPMRLKRLPHITLVVDGCIYNFRELSKRFNFDYETSCDIEVLIHLYDAFGPKEAAALLDGEFAFLLFDASESLVVVGRDTLGIKPLFTFLSADGMLAVASEMKGIGYMEKRSESFYIKEFLPASYAVYSLDKADKAMLLRCEKFKDMVEMPKFFTINPELQGFLQNTTVYENIKHNIRILLEGAVRKRIPSDIDTINCLASGGLDSTIIACLVHKIIKEDKLPISIKSFTIGMEGAPDLTNGRICSKFIGSQHTEVVYTMEEGLATLRDIIYTLETYDITTIRASIPMNLLARHIKRNSSCPVVMSGEGSDEVTQGYIYFKNAPSPQDAHLESVRLLEEVYKFDVIRTDRTTAVNSLDVRAPFCDVSFISYYLSIPPELRIPKDGVEKFLLRDAFAGTCIVPEELLWRPKEAFSDGVSPHQKSWGTLLKDHFETFVSDADFSEASSKFPYFTPTTKEAFYYRCLFAELFPVCDNVVSHYWLPKWLGACADPSARTWPNYTTAA